MSDPYIIGSNVRFSDNIKLSHTRKGSDAYRVISQKRTGKVVTFFGTALKWNDRSVTVRFPPMNGRQKEITFYDVPVYNFEEVI